MSYAKATIIGRLTRDPEMKQTNGGKDVVNFSLAVNRRFDKNDTVDYFDCTAWGKTAEIISAHKKQGDQVAVQGDLQIDSFEKDGIKRTKPKVVVQDVIFLAAKGENAASGGNVSQKDLDDIPF